MVTWGFDSARQNKVMLINQDRIKLCWLSKIEYGYVD